MWGCFHWDLSDGSPPSVEVRRFVIVGRCCFDVDGVVECDALRFSCWVCGVRFAVVGFLSRRDSVGGEEWAGMKGSRRGASRPQRQARSGVTYKESDDDDDEFVPNARLASDVAGRRSSLRNSVVEVEELGIAKGKRTLTLKRARTVVRHLLHTYFLCSSYWLSIFYGACLKICVSRPFHLWSCVFGTAVSNCPRAWDSSYSYALGDSDILNWVPLMR